MKRFIVAAAALAVLASALLVAACGGVKVPAGAVAAIKDGGVVTQERYDEILSQAKAQITAQQGAFPEEDTEQFKQIRASIVSYLVLNEIITKVATEESVEVTISGEAVDVPMKAEVTEKEYEDYYKSLVERLGGQKKLDELLKEQKISAESLEWQLRAQLLQSEVQQKIADAVKVGDAEIKDYYEKNESQFVVGPSVTARHVLVKTEAQAEKVRQLLLADNTDAGWKRVAKQYSTDASNKNTGGDLGSFTKGKMVPAFEKAAFALKVGQVSQPVKTQFGWHVLEVTDTAKGSTQTLEQAKPMIQQQLLYTKQSTVWQDWVKKAQDDAGAAYAPGFNPEELTASPSPAASPTE